MLNEAMKAKIERIIFEGERHLYEETDERQKALTVQTLPKDQEPMLAKWFNEIYGAYFMSKLYNGWECGLSMHVKAQLLRRYGIDYPKSDLEKVVKHIFQYATTLEGQEDGQKLEYLIYSQKFDIAFIVYCSLNRRDYETVRFITVLPKGRHHIGAKDAHKTKKYIIEGVEYEFDLSLCEAEISDEIEVVVID